MKTRSAPRAGWLHSIQPLICRLVCSNGMVINDAKTRRNHVGRAATSEEDFSIYSNETLLADDHAFVLKIKDTVRAAISEARFAQAVSRMRESTVSPAAPARTAFSTSSAAMGTTRGRRART